MQPSEAGPPGCLSGWGWETVPSAMSVETPTKPAPVARAEATGEQAGESAVLETPARAGFVARAAIDAVIGVLAVKVAVGWVVTRPISVARSRRLPASRSGRDCRSWLRSALAAMRFGGCSSRCSAMGLRARIAAFALYSLSYARDRRI